MAKKTSVEKYIKKPSVRLRAVLYRLWEQTRAKDDFNRFYEESIEIMIGAIKNKLVRKDNKKWQVEQTDIEHSSGSDEPSRPSAM